MCRMMKEFLRWCNEVVHEERLRDHERMAEVGKVVHAWVGVCFGLMYR